MKEETAPASAPFVLRWPERATLRRALVPALFIALALLVTSGYGGGVQLNDGQADLHIDPLKFLGSLLQAWNPALYLGTHTGFWVPYETPYSLFYGLAQALHVSQELAQRVAVFSVYLACLASMYFCLRSVAPWLSATARVAGSCAYLFNMYVALNSQAQIVWLLTYATLPAMIGVTALAMRDEMNVWRASLAVALLVLVGAGINPPLVAINVILLAIFVVVTILFDPSPAAAARRTYPYLAAAAIGAVLVNLYWVVPIVDYFRGVWLNGVLSEAPSMHNAATSFDNVLRGLGHWATFVSFAGRPYFPWAAPYEAGFFGALLWFVPIVALGGIAFRRNQRPATLYFLIATLVSVPLVVGYYHDALGDAVTTPIYDAFYRNFPGFQMFRFSYKWVAGVEFGISGLYAIAAGALVASLRERVAALAAPEQTRWSWTVPAFGGAIIAIPILVFIPVIVNKMNYPGPILPSWEYREKALVGNDQRQRVALFPTQFLEQFDWGTPQFYIENSFVDRPMIYGLLGSEPSEGTDRWVRRAYRATREGLPFAADMFRVLGVDTFLQRDDFIPAIDFSSPGEWRYNTTTLTHDLLGRVIGSTPVRSDGPLRVYHLGGALPLVYGVVHPVVSTFPSFSDAYLGDVDAMAKGSAEFEPVSRSEYEFSTELQSLSPILPASAEQVRDLAVNQALEHGGARIHAPPAEAGWSTPFDLRSGGRYTVFALEQSLLFERYAPQNLAIDGNYFTPKTSGGAWTEYGTIQLSGGSHTVSDGFPDPDFVVALVKSEDFAAWRAQIAAAARALPQNLSLTSLVYGDRASVTIPRAGTFRIRATAIGAFGPDGVVRAKLRRNAYFRGVFPSDLSATLPYIVGDGVTATAFLMMPEAWYRDDAAAYQWQRGDPMSWFLFAHTAHARVFVPGGNDVTARVALRISRLQTSPIMSVGVDGRVARSVALPGPPADAAANDTVDRLGGPVPVPVSFELRLHPGWNDVAFSLPAIQAQRGAAVRNAVAAAVAPDFAFTEISRVPAGSPQVVRDRTFTAIALPSPAALAGDPDVLASLDGTVANGTWLAVSLRAHGTINYRLFPIAPGDFAVSFMHAFPNGWNDASERVAGLWVLSRGGKPHLSGVAYKLHGMPAQAMRQPQSLMLAPLRVDGKAVGGTAVFLSSGRHRISSADQEVKIGMLTIAPASLPKTQSFALDWQRRSSTALDVTVAKNTGPFLLVFGEAYHPKWSATLNGQPLQHVVVDGVVNGWIVPTPQAAGTTIALRFTDQRSYGIATAISLIGLFALGALAYAPQLWPVRSSNP